MWQAVIAFVLIFLILLLGIGVDRAYRAFARRHPELGPWRRSGCGQCGAGHCARRH